VPFECISFDWNDGDLDLGAFDLNDELWWTDTSSRESGVLMANSCIPLSDKLNKSTIPLWPTCGCGPCFIKEWSLLPSVAGLTVTLFPNVDEESTVGTFIPTSEGNGPEIVLLTDFSPKIERLFILIGSCSGAACAWKTGFC
jgi:hypothetical protein